MSPFISWAMALSPFALASVLGKPAPTGLHRIPLNSVSMARSPHV